VFYPRTAAEVLALGILARHGWQPVTQDKVQPVRRIRARVIRRKTARQRRKTRWLSHK
jgi:hypothetical protein